MFIVIKDMYGHELRISQYPAVASAVQVDLTLNDGSDPTQIQLLFSPEQKEAVVRAFDFFS